MQRILAAALIPVALSGCFPVTLLEAPGYDLKIIDARTHKPISEAAVGVSGGNRGEQLVSTASDANGCVHTEHVMRRVWLPLAFDPMVPPIHLTISADGYQTRELSGFDSLFVPRGCGSGEHDCRYTQSTDIDAATIALEAR